MADLYAIRHIRVTAVRMWTIAGIALLANFVVRALFTGLGPLNRIHTNVPNTTIGLFPFIYLPGLPGLLVPIALCLHVLTLRALPRAIDPAPSPGDRRIAAEG